MVDFLNDFFSGVPDFVWELGVGIVLICVALYFLWKYLDTGSLPSGKDFKLKF